MSLTLTERITSIKEKALAVEPLRKTIPLNEIEFVKTDLVKIMGKHMSLEREAFKDLLRLIGVTLESGKRLAKDEEIGSRVINLVKGAMTKNKDLNVQIVVDRSLTSILRIYSKSQGSKISTSGFFTVVERLLNTDNFDVFKGPSGISVNKRGEIVINLVSENTYQIGNLANEVFKTGISITNRGGVMVRPFSERLICANGNMSMMIDEDEYFMNNMNQLDDWMRSMSKLKARNYVSAELESRVLTAMNTKASLNELQYVRAHMLKLVGDQFHKPEEIERFCETEATMAGFAKAGIDVELLSNAQARHLRTAVPMWNLINGMTDFASHDHYGWNINDYDRNRMLMLAGNMLTDQFECENMVPVQVFN